MRSALLIAAILLALTTPTAVAEEKRFYGSAAAWECEGGTVISNKGYLSFEATLGSQYGEKGFPPARGSQHFTWDMRGGRENIRLNGKLCKRAN